MFFFAASAFYASFAKPYVEGNHDDVSTTPPVSYAKKIIALAYMVVILPALKHSCAKWSVPAPTGHKG